MGLIGFLFRPELWGNTSLLSEIYLSLSDTPASSKSMLGAHINLKRDSGLRGAKKEKDLLYPQILSSSGPKSILASY